MNKVSFLSRLFVEKSILYAQPEVSTYAEQFGFGALAVS